MPHMARSKVLREAEQVRDDLVSEKIKEALVATEGSKVRAAKKLNIPLRTFFRRLKKLGLQDWYDTEGKNTPKPAAKRKSA